MFDIEYKGGNAVVIASKKTSLVVDPKVSLLGLKDLKVKDLVEFVTESRFATGKSDAQVIINSPGEYEVGDFTIIGIAATRHIDTPDDEKRSTIYRVECGEVSLGIIGNIAPGLSDEQLESLGVIDILIVPVGGGGYTLDATSAVSIVRAIDPKVVIPVHYRDAALQYEVPQDEVETFIKELGAPVDNVTKFKVKNDSSLPSVLTTVVVARS
jgi:Zn-dependent hydrolase of the beta-lactamase fold-like protein